MFNFIANIFMKKSHKDYDKFLRELPKTGNHSECGTLDSIALNYLQGRGYLNLNDDVDRNPITAGLTDNGKVFIAEGGFKNEFVQKQRESFKFFTSFALTCAALAISALTYRDAKNDQTENRLRIKVLEQKIIEQAKLVESLTKARLQDAIKVEKGKKNLNR